MTGLANKRILLGVSGSIAAFKAADLCSRLSKLGADVHVVLTEHAARFVGPPTFRALTRNPVIIDLFEEPHAKRIAHIDLAQSADLVLVAPASANILARLALGLANDMLSTCLLATPADTPLLLAPAMNQVMWAHPATVTNLSILRARGVQIIEPGYGLLACQDLGYGKLAEADDIVDAVVQRLSPVLDLTGMRLLVTAGATREPLDPVRFLSNRSSGKMGLAIADRAARRGANVTVVRGYATAATPQGVRVVDVGTADEMLAACEREFPGADVFVGAAAVADYAPTQAAASKIKKRDDASDLVLHLRRTPDIIAALGRSKRPGQLVIGFAAETEALCENALGKLRSKNLDMIVANDVTAEGAGFDADTNIVTLLWPDGRTAALRKMPKSDVAERLLDEIAALMRPN